MAKDVLPRPAAPREQKVCVCVGGVYEHMYVYVDCVWCVYIRVVYVSACTPVNVHVCDV